MMCRSLMIVALFLGGLSRTLLAAEAEPAVSIAFVGDIMLAETPGALIKRGGDPFKPFAALLRDADIRVGNLECLVATSGSAEPDKTFTFRAHPRVLDVLKRHFDAVALANNHSAISGQRPSLKCWAAWSRNRSAISVAAATSLPRTHR